MAELGNTLVPVLETDETATADEVVARLETNGGYVSYGINIPVFAHRARDSYALARDSIPGVFRTVIDGALFGLRHGPLQKMGREHGLDVGAILKASPDKDAEAVGLLAYMLFHSARKAQVVDGEMVPFDFTHGDMVAAYGGIFRRLKVYDALPSKHSETPEPDALPTPDAADRADGEREARPVRD